MLLTPIADLHIGSPIDSMRRVLHYGGHSIIFLRRCLAGSTMDPEFMSAGYRFTGLISTNAVLFDEQSVYIRFTWFVILISAIWLTRRLEGGKQALWAASI